MVVQAHGVSKRHADQLVFESVDLQVGAGERVALLGRNGSGKTTLLRILAKLEPSDSGNVVRFGRLGLLEQRAGLGAGRLLEQVMPAAFLGAQQELERAGAGLQDPSAANLERFSLAEEAFRVLGGYELEARAAAVLAGLGLDAEHSGVLSGGQTRRALLARLLIEPQDVYLLDEPTNHLDLESIAWLEAWIASSPAAFLIVSHDRAFLDATVQRCLELERGQLQEYPGNFSQAMAWKQSKLEAAKLEFENHTRVVRALEAEQRKATQRAGSGFDRSRLKDNNILAAKGAHRAGAKTAGARAKAIGKRIEHLGEIEKPFDDRFMTRIKLGPIAHGPNEVLGFEQLQLRRADRVVLENVNGVVRRGERLALLGPNGGGKSTLIAGILGQLTPSTGAVRRGLGLSLYWAGQDTQELNAHRTLADALLASNPDLKLEETYALLASLGLPKEPSREISSLSGGQRTRLSLARLSVTRAQLLVLDEPTNNLDVDAIGALERLLLAYSGTVVFASHDRRLLEVVAMRRWLVGAGRVLELS